LFERLKTSFFRPHSDIYKRRGTLGLRPFILYENNRISRFSDLVRMNGMTAFFSALKHSVTG
ncbi:MAG: hypothetical protein AB2693_24935, partial [Candidatus Thiodiazotropha sp.]